MEEYASLQNASLTKRNEELYLENERLKKQIELLTIRDEKREAKFNTIAGENGGLYATVEKLEQRSEDLEKLLKEKTDILTKVDHQNYALMEKCSSLLERIAELEKKSKIENGIR